MCAACAGVGAAAAPVVVIVVDDVVEECHDIWYSLRNNAKVCTVQTKSCDSGDESEMAW